MESLLLLLGTKLMERKKFRDYMEIYAISLLLLAGSGAILPSIRFLFLSLALLIVLNACCVFLAFFVEAPEVRLGWTNIRRLLLTSLFVPCLAFPLATVIFIVLPRTEYPILGFLERPRSVRTGFTDTVRLGVTSKIYEDEGARFRVHMERLQGVDLYFRGIVLDSFDGVSWKRSDSRPRRPPPLKGRAVSQVVILEPQDHPYLFALDRPVELNMKEARAFPDLSFVSLRPIEKRVTYRAVSLLSEAIPASGEDLRLFCEVPPTISRQIRGLAFQLTRGRDEEGKVREVTEYLKKNHLHVLSGLPVSKDPLEDFLFVKRQGNCEFFASACAILLRIAGVPTRLVGGFKGGYYNELGGYYLVTGRHAHVWVEAYIRGKGWVRIDPTPPSAPPMNLLLRLRMVLDTMNYLFYRSVLGYSLEKQLKILDLLRNVRLKRPSIRFEWNHLLRFLLPALLLFALPLLWKRKKRSREEILLGLFLKRMRRMGYLKRPCDGLTEFVFQIADRDLRERVEGFVSAFEALYYRDIPVGKAEFNRLRGLIKGIKKKTSSSPAPKGPLRRR
jgi:transglutaminase-like putative cysteine protease